LSDRAFLGEYEDRSGPEIVQLTQSFFQQHRQEVTIDLKLIPDDPTKLRSMIDQALSDKITFLFTTGGTGLGPKDFTPDVIKEYLQKDIPGIMEMIRVKYGMKKPNALVSRSIAGVINQTLVFALPGSVKAVREYMQEILPTLFHSLKMVYGVDDHN